MALCGTQLRDNKRGWYPQRNSSLEKVTLQPLRLPPLCQSRLSPMLRLLIHSENHLLSVGSMFLEHREINKLLSASNQPTWAGLWGRVAFSLLPPVGGIVVSSAGHS